MTEERAIVEVDARFAFRLATVIPGNDRTEPLQ